MNDTPTEPRRWSGTRWWVMLAAILAIQLGLILWLGSRGPLPPRGPAAAPTLRIAGPAFEDLVALTDPTLFALPHQQGFAGPAWLSLHRIGAEPFVWSEPTRWLMLPVEQLGSVFRSYIATNQFVPPQPAFVIQPEPISSDLPALPGLPAKSILKLAGGLRGLALQTHFELQSQTNSEILTNSVVQVLIAPDGRPVSATLLSSSGRKEADQIALQQAAHSRFQPLAQAAGQLTNKSSRLIWGQMIFEWHTVPPPANSVPSTP
ncbi:MAG TPA: hypothetical protein VL361_11995 [Candidatus Limnocylindrales bacterium]|nr:hypothetical protein [Candidatus Limnocylindrales bacterium]